MIERERKAVGRLVLALKSDLSLFSDAPPVLHELSLYTLADEVYDDSFAIEKRTGRQRKAYYGECGVTVARTIHEDGFETATAFGVWLHDPQDEETVGKVFVSLYGFLHQDLHDELSETTHEIILIAPDAVAVLETSFLRLYARVLDVQYGEDEILPPNSYFVRVVFELAAWVKDERSP